MTTYVDFSNPRTNELHTLLEDSLNALARLRLEAMHYRNTGVGEQFLNAALDHATTIIMRDVDLPYCVACGRQNADAHAHDCAIFNA